VILLVVLSVLGAIAAKDLARSFYTDYKTSNKATTFLYTVLDSIPDTQVSDDALDASCLARMRCKNLIAAKPKALSDLILKKATGKEVAPSV
jgi:hypothetical protein